MKPKSNSPRLFLVASIAPLLATTITAQTIQTWDANGNATNTVLTDALNWSGDALPASTGATAATRHDAQWDGSISGDLNLTFASAFGGSFGAGLVMTAGQTGNLTLTNTDAATQNLRIINSTSGTTGGIQIASGAGALTIGAAGASNPIQLVLGSGASALNYFFANNSANTATIEENVTTLKGGSHAASLIFSAGNWNVKGVVSDLGAGGLNVNAGSVTVSANNTFTAAVNVNGGTLSISAADNLGTGTGAVRLGQTTTSGVLEFTGSSNATISRLMRIGNGASAGQTGSATMTNIGTGVLTFDNATFNEVGATAVGVNRVLTLSGNNTGDNAISGVIADNNPGTVKVDKAGTGKWLLSGNNTFTGGVDIDGGTLAIGHDNALGTGGLRFDSTTARIQSSDATDRTIGNAINFAQSMKFGATGTGNLLFTGAVAGGSGLKIIDVASGHTTEFSNTITGNGDRAKEGAGTLVLSGDNSASTSTLYANAGTLAFTSANALGSGTSSIRVGQTSANAVLKFTGASDAIIARQINIGNGNSTGHTGSSTIQNDSLTGSLTFGNATFNLAGNAVEARSLTLRGTNTGNNLISGAIVDNIGANATVNLVKNDAGTWNLTGENTFSGGIQIWNGVLEFDGNGSLGAQTIQTRIGRLSTSGTLRHTGAGNTTVTGQVQVGFGNGGTGNATIESSGAGTLSFNNAAFNNAESAANAHRTLTLGGNNTGANTISGAIVNNNNTTAKISIAKSGAGTWNLTGTNTYTGDTTLNEGLLTSLNNLAVASGSTLRFNGGSISVNGGAGYILNSGTMDVNGQTIAAGSYEASPFWAPNAKLMNSSATAAVIDGTGSKNTVWINSTGAIIETVGNLTISSIVNGANGFTKTGNGTLFLTNVTSYTGNTTISAGTLSMSYPSLSDNSTVTINGGTLNLNFEGEDQVDKAFALLGGVLLVELSPGVYDYSDGVGITGSGLLRVGPPPAAGYSAWASAFSSPALSDTASTADPDNDGLINAVEYALGLDPRFSSPSPGVITNSGKTITFTKGAEAKVDPKVTYGIEVSTTLGVAPSPWTLGIAPDVTETADTIAITFPAGPVKNFARLKVILAP